MLCAINPAHGSGRYGFASKAENFCWTPHGSRWVTDQVNETQQIERELCPKVRTALFSVQPLCSLCLCGVFWLGIHQPQRHREHRGCTEKSKNQEFEAKPRACLRRTHPLPRGGSDCVQAWFMTVEAKPGDTSSLDLNLPPTAVGGFLVQTADSTSRLSSLFSTRLVICRVGSVRCISVRRVSGCVVSGAHLSRV